MTQPPERTTRREMAQMLAPLTVLPGGDRLNKPAIEAYFQAFKSFYPFELEHEAALRCIRLYGEHVIPKFDTDPVHRSTRCREGTLP